MKRRKERAGRETVESKKKEEKQQKPDLTKLSADLPSGWQVLLPFSHYNVCFVNENAIAKTLSLDFHSLSLPLAGVLGRI